MYIAWGWLNEKEPKHVATIDTTLNKIVVLDWNFVYNLLIYKFYWWKYTFPNFFVFRYTWWWANEAEIFVHSTVYNLTYKSCNWRYIHSFYFILVYFTTGCTTEVYCDNCCKNLRNYNSIVWNYSLVNIRMFKIKLFLERLKGK
jgi:hypothetical protein